MAPPKKKKETAAQRDKRIADAIAKAMGGVEAGVDTGGGAGRQPLGVHKGYVAPGQKFTRGGFDEKNERHVSKGSAKTKGQKPRYMDGAVTEIFGAMSPGMRFELQGSLKRLGLIKKINGQFDGPMKEAMGRMLGAANAKGVTWKQFLVEQIAMLDEMGIQSVDDLNGDGSGARRPADVQVSNPDTIKAELETTGRSLIGSSVGGINQARFVQEFQADEVRAQTQDYNNQDPDGQGGTSVAEPTVAGKLIAENPNEFKTEQLVGKHYSDILNALTGNASQGLGA